MFDTPNIPGASRNISGAHLRRIASGASPRRFPDRDYARVLHPKHAAKCKYECRCIIDHRRSADNKRERERESARKREKERMCEKA